MTKTHGPSIYIPTDKNIFDAFHHKKATTKELRLFLRKKGIIASNLTTKEDLIRKICRIPFGYRDYQYITELLENPNRKEKITRSAIRTSTTQKEVVESAEKVKSELLEKGESTTINITGNKIFVRSTYVEIDFTKTELKQRQRKVCEVELELNSDELTIRRPASKKGQEISDLLRKKLSEEKDTELIEENISLETVTDPKSRTLFFDKLIKKIPGYHIFDVIDVNVHHIDDKGEDIEKENDENGEENIISSKIVKAALSGEGVLESEQFSQLHEEGFYISKIIWIVEDKDIGGDRIELEAEFGDPRLCKDFKYLVRGIFRYNDSRGHHNATRRPASKTELHQYNPLLEKAAKEAAEETITSFFAGEKNES